MKGKTKQIQRNFRVAMLAFGAFFLIVLFNNFVDLYDRRQLDSGPTQSGEFGEVAKYTPLLERELRSVGLEEHTVLLAAVMHQESKGKGGDPMQSSESAGMAPNSIQDPQLSIKYGVKHFQRAVARGNEKNVDFPTIVQAYNMGLGYIDFIAERGGRHSEELAKQFSMIQVNKNPETYNCGGDKSNFRYPYCYGDFSYSTKVADHMERIGFTQAVNAGVETQESSF
ncbi:membrane protein [Mesobacillus campisalis]|uniref:Membrane protein n=1 Tax=Mesobacillus campisalis TaxID=1408103 RepID=A0A0M2T035_9BACI|nr:lysozyme family protein [Mesobacillus campisalis]KKK38592.1 membrane protein [Mesobacillus campisalis]